MTDYLTIPDVLAIHADQIEQHGGSRATYNLSSSVSKEVRSTAWRKYVTVVKPAPVTSRVLEYCGRTSSSTSIANAQPAKCAISGKDSDQLDAAEASIFC